MQIHEITKSKIDEGVGSFLGNLAGKIAAGAQKVGQAIAPVGAAKAAYAGAVRPQQTAMLGKKVAQIWSNYTQQLKAATPDPARYNTMYQQALAAFVQKNLLAGQPIASAMNKQEINQLIAQTTAVKDNAQQVAALIGKLVQQAAVSQQDTTVASLVKVISTNPTVLQYRGVDYAQNANGDWANQKTQKVPDESFQAFLDAEARRAGA
jgi:hypothetical protein